PPPIHELHSFPTRRSSDLGRWSRPSPSPACSWWFDPSPNSRRRPERRAWPPPFRTVGTSLQTAPANLLPQVSLSRVTNWSIGGGDRKSTRLNSSHDQISYA